MFDIENIQFNHFLIGKLCTTAHLPKPGNPGSTLHSFTSPLVIRFGFFRELGAWADQTHVACQNIQKLRNLIHAEAPDPPAHTGDAWIFLDFEKRARSFV